MAVKRQSEGNHLHRDELRAEVEHERRLDRAAVQAVAHLRTRTRSSRSVRRVGSVEGTWTQTDAPEGTSKRISEVDQAVVSKHLLIGEHRRAAGAGRHALREVCRKRAEHWKVMEGCGRSWKVMKGRGRSWTVVDGHGRSRTVVDGHGRPWEAMGGHGRLWKAIDGHGRPRELADTCARFIARTQSIECCWRMRRATTSASAWLPPCELYSTSFRMPARATELPISLHAAAAVSAEISSVPVKVAEGRGRSRKVAEGRWTVRGDHGRS